MKICVYAICKNEEKFVDRWVKSMKEADDIYVLDTGSTDNTIEKLKEKNVHVKKELIVPWRFDVARNKSLEMIKDDYDIYVCTDLDEVFNENWRKVLEDNWLENTTRARYTYNWKLKGNKPLVSFYSDKIHTKGYTWKYPVHEVLECSFEENYVTLSNIILNHYPDTSKSRASYLSLLELSVKENPTDDRNMHYLGREYMYYGKWNKCIDTLIKHLSLKSANWADERCASMRFIARSYKNLNRYEEAKMWLIKAIDEAPYLRDAYIELGILEYEYNHFDKASYYIEEGLKIKEHIKTYINETFCWDETPYDILSVCYYNLNNLNKSLENIENALKINPKNKRIKNNKKIIENLK